MKSKKAAEGIMWTVVVIALLLLFLLIYSGVWSKLFGKSASSLSEQIGSADDYDKDGVINIVDKCPCQAGDPNNDGCPYTNRNEDRLCLTKAPSTGGKYGGAGASDNFK